MGSEAVGRAELERLKWKCRRGLLELDLVLERLLQRQAAAMTDNELAAVGKLLEYPDHDLWDVVSGKSDRYDERFSGIVTRLRAC